MTTSGEARVWQAMGATAIAGGGALLLATVKLYGVVYADPSALAIGLAASFVMLAGISGFLAGRVLHSVSGGETHREAMLWRFLAGVAVGAGAVAVTLAWKESEGKVPTLDHLAMGLAGSFMTMVGILALLAQRVMHHVTEQRKAAKG
ncbi:MAG TPA: hypothetical protein VGQ94_09045 [Terriglobales bacterium]|jgi:hypothetical protein|nr:hypothetical protein [Terriglobales bacterium]